MTVSTDRPLGRALDSTVAATKSGMMRAAAIAVNVVKADVRAMTRGAGFSQRLANTWRGKVFPAQPSLTPAVWVQSNAEHIIAAFEEGVTIAPVRGSRYLWIPTPNVPKAGRKRMTPGAVEERFGDFSYAPVKGSPGRFVALVDAARGKTGRLRKASKRARATGATERVVMFILVRRVTLAKRLDVAGVRRRAQSQWARIVAESLSEAYRNSRDGERL